MSTPPGSFPLGRIGPIPLYAHWTSLLLVFLAWDWSQGSQTTFGAVLLALVLGIVLHECGHGLTAVAFRARDVSITLWAFGGVCSSRREQRPWAELAILVAGPLVSFLLAGVGLLGVIGLEAGVDSDQPLLHGLQQLPFIEQLAWYTLLLNGILGLFNCMPLFPLDGGQIVYQLQLALGVRTPVAKRTSLILAFIVAGILLLYLNSGGFSIFNTVLILFLLMASWSALAPRAEDDAAQHSR